MIKNLLKIGLIFSFIVVCWETNWIEDIFNLNYCVAPDWCENMLLGLIASILIWKNKETKNGR